MTRINHTFQNKRCTTNHPVPHIDLGHSLRMLAQEVGIYSISNTLNDEELNEARVAMCKQQHENKIQAEKQSREKARLYHDHVAVYSLGHHYGVSSFSPYDPDALEADYRRKISYDGEMSSFQPYVIVREEGFYKIVKGKNNKLLGDRYDFNDNNLDRYSSSTHQSGPGLFEEPVCKLLQEAKDKIHNEILTTDKFIELTDSGNKIIDETNFIKNSIQKKLEQDYQNKISQQCESFLSNMATRCLKLSVQGNQLKMKNKIDGLNPG